MNNMNKILIGSLLTFSMYSNLDVSVASAKTPIEIKVPIEYVTKNISRGYKSLKNKLFRNKSKSNETIDILVNDLTTILKTNTNKDYNKELAKYSENDLFSLYRMLVLIDDPVTVSNINGEYKKYLSNGFSKTGDIYFSLHDKPEEFPQLILVDSEFNNLDTSDINSFGYEKISSYIISENVDAKNKNFPMFKFVPKKDNLKIFYSTNKNSEIYCGKIKILD